MFLHPLFLVVMYALVLSKVLSSKLPGIDNQFSYAIYLTAGILAWNYFSEVVTRCLTLFIDNGNLLKKLNFPRICLPVIVAGSSTISSIFLLMAIFCVFAVLGHELGSTLIWLPLLYFLTLSLAMSVGLILGVLNVFLRDIGQVVPVMLQFLFWFTPIVYMPTVVPEYFQRFLAYSPVYHLVNGYQQVLVFGNAPDWQFRGLLGVLVLDMFLLMFAYILFRRACADIVDTL